MKGDMIKNGNIEPNIHIASITTPDHIEIYRETENGRLENYLNLINCKVNIIDESLEISGYEFLKEYKDKAFNDGRAFNGERYEYVELAFHPHGKKNAKENPKLGEIQEAIEQIRIKKGPSTVVKSRSGKLKYMANKGVYT